MSKQDEKQFSQRGAAEYLRNEHGLNMRPTILSILRTYGHGPQCEPIGRQVVYAKSALDQWADVQKSRNEDAA